MPLQEVASGTGPVQSEQPLIDIFAVHGLNPTNKTGHAFATWTKPEGHIWLRDDLPKSLPRARIYIAEYDSNPIFAGRDRFILRASSLLEEIRVKRDEIDDEKRPIIFIAHSLGGILVKQALVNARNNPKYGHLLEATSGLIFFSTPHAGGKDAMVRLGDIASKIARAVLFQSSNDTLEALKDGSMFSDILKEQFRHQLESYQIISFYERLGNVRASASCSQFCANT
jgi:Putative serine esterase (DUF676)